MNLDLSVVADEAKLAEFVHEMADTGSGGADHLRQCFLTDVVCADWPHAAGDDDCRDALPPHAGLRIYFARARSAKVMAGFAFDRAPNEGRRRAMAITDFWRRMV